MNGNVRLEPREPPISMCRMVENPEPENPPMVNPAHELPEAMEQVMRSMDDGEHAMALRCLRQKNQEGTADQGIYHSLM